MNRQKCYNEIAKKKKKTIKIRITNNHKYVRIDLLKQKCRQLGKQKNAKYNIVETRIQNENKEQKHKC